MFISGDKVKCPSDTLCVSDKKVQCFDHKPREFHKAGCKLVRECLCIEMQNLKLDQSAFVSVKKKTDFYGFNLFWSINWVK